MSELQNVQLLPPGFYWDLIFTILAILAFLIPFILLRKSFDSLLDLITGKKKKSKSKTPNPKTHEKELKKLDKIYGTYTMAKIDKMPGQDFEKFVEKLFRVVYKDIIIKTEPTPVTGDHGCDLVVHLKNGNKLGIQCKRYSGNVGNTAVQNIVTAQRMYGLTHTMVITNSYFTPSAMEAARSNNVQMINRDQLEVMIRKYNEIIKEVHNR